MATLKEISQRKDRLTGGHRLCAGCGAAIAVRQILLSTEYPLVVANATGCLEVATTIYPYSAWDTPWMHNAFENAAATISGIEAAYQALKKKGKVDKEIKFIAFGGDGGTYDIGLQALSGALERGHDFVYVCYDNEAYMNTGYQRSGATPTYANTTTAPVGKKIPGKLQKRKNLTAIAAAHDIPYVAQASIANFNDLIRKAQKAIETPGPAFLNVFSPCIPGWKIRPNQTIEVAKLALDTKFWPIYEVENGKWKLNYKPRKEVPLEDFLKLQGRFKHLLKPENKELLENLKKQVEDEWQALLERCGEA